MTIEILLNQFYTDLLLVKRDSEQTAITYKISAEEFLNWLVTEHIKLKDVSFDKPYSVTVLGKGRKIRNIPIISVPHGAKMTAGICRSGRCASTLVSPICRTP